MRPESEQHSLLDDVLSEAAPADFERVLLDGTLRAVRRRRRIRQCSRGLAAIGIFAAIALARLVRAAAHHVGPFGSARAANRQFEAAASVASCRHQARQRRGRDLFAGDIRGGRDGCHQRPVRTDRRRAITGGGRGASGGIGTARSAPGRAALLESGRQERVSCAMIEGIAILRP